MIAKANPTRQIDLQVRHARSRHAVHMSDIHHDATTTRPSHRTIVCAVRKVTSVRRIDTMLMTSGAAVSATQNLSQLWFHSTVNTRNVDTMPRARSWIARSLHDDSASTSVGKRQEGLPRREERGAERRGSREAPRADADAHARSPERLVAHRSDRAIEVLAYGEHLRLGLREHDDEHRCARHRRAPSRLAR